MSIEIYFDSKKCVGCGACAIACMDQNDIDLERQQPLRKIFKKETVRNGNVKVSFLSAACRHCENAPCAARCPKGCIKRNEQSGLVICDNTSCIGCRLCAAACSYGSISFDSDNKMQKCNGCAERVTLGLQPACTAACPYGALVVRERRSKQKESIRLVR